MEIIVNNWSTTDGWDFIQTKSGVYKRRINSWDNWQKVYYSYLGINI